MSRAKWRTPLRYLSISLWTILLLVTAYGMYRFGDAPFRLVDGQYVGKWGQPHSNDDFEHLQVFEGVFVTAWVAAAAAAIASHLQDRRSRRR